MSGLKPLVSIITPSFNKGNYIEDTIQSVQNQTYKNIEHIIIDANSTDITPNILKKYNNIKTLIEPDEGQSDAINKGFKISKGDIIAYLNADDIYLPNTIESVVLFFESHPNIDMVYGDGITSDEFGQNQCIVKCGEFNLKQLIFCQNNIFQPSVFWKRHILYDVGEIDKNLHLAMDLDYWIRTAITYNIEYLPEVLSVAKIYKDAKSSAFMFKYIKEYEYILQKIFSSATTPIYIKQYQNDAYTIIYAKGGLDYLHSIMIWNGIIYILKSFYINPYLCIKSIKTLITNYIKKEKVK
jgi:glycosyltransferase involved in cell wall biosynthesis